MGKKGRDGFKTLGDEIPIRIEEPSALRGHEDGEEKKKGEKNVITVSI